MAPTELALLEQRYRRIYELARLRRALVGFVPILILIVTSVVFGGRPATALVAGPQLFAAGVLALWYGREPGRGVLPGALAGGAALVLVLCANQMGHFCTGSQCVSWCLPACIAGGLLAGGAVSVVGVRERRGLGYWLSSSAITLLVGALGCSCVGFSGMIGLGMGFLLVTVGCAVAASMRR
jgi:hypothetical protein